MLDVSGAFTVVFSLIDNSWFVKYMFCPILSFVSSTAVPNPALATPSRLEPSP